MKKILFTLTIGLTSIIAFSSFTYAQNSDSPVAFNDVKNFKSSIRNLAALESLTFMGTYVPEIKDINSKAIKDFQVRYNRVKNAMWFSDRNGFVSYFVQDGFGDRVFYDKKGRWQFSLVLYGEDKLPCDIRASVKSTYFDLAITQVEEVQTIDGAVYIINLEDKSNIKILKVNKEGEMDILMELIKEQ